MERCPHVRIIVNREGTERRPAKTARTADPTRGTRRISAPDGAARPIAAPTVSQPAPARPRTARKAAKYVQTPGRWKGITAMAKTSAFGLKTVATNTSSARTSAADTEEADPCRQSLKLLKAGLAREIKAKTGMEAWRRDEETGQAYSLKLTDAGLKAIAADERGSQSIPSTAVPQNTNEDSSKATTAANMAAARSATAAPTSRRPAKARRSRG